LPLYQPTTTASAVPAGVVTDSARFVINCAPPIAPIFPHAVSLNSFGP